VRVDVFSAGPKEVAGGRGRQGILLFDSNPGIAAAVSGGADRPAGLCRGEPRGAAARRRWPPGRFKTPKRQSAEGGARGRNKTRGTQRTPVSGLCRVGVRPWCGREIRHPVTSCRFDAKRWLHGPGALGLLGSSEFHREWGAFPQGIKLGWGRTFFPVRHVGRGLNERQGRRKVRFRGGLALGTYRGPYFGTLLPGYLAGQGDVRTRGEQQGVRRNGWRGPAARASKATVRGNSPRPISLGDNPDGVGIKNWAGARRPSMGV